MLSSSYNFKKSSLSCTCSPRIKFFGLPNSLWVRVSVISPRDLFRLMGLLQAFWLSFAISLRVGCNCTVHWPIKFNRAPGELSLLYAARFQGRGGSPALFKDRDPKLFPFFAFVVTFSSFCFCSHSGFCHSCKHSRPRQLLPADHRE